MIGWVGDQRGGDGVDACGRHTGETLVTRRHLREIEAGVGYDANAGETPTSPSPRHLLCCRRVLVLMKELRDPMRQAVLSEGMVEIGDADLI